MVVPTGGAHLTLCKQVGNMLRVLVVRVALPGTSKDWVAVKEVKLSYQNGYTGYIGFTLSGLSCHNGYIYI